MPARWTIPSIVALGLAGTLGLSATALADDVVVPPLVPRGSTQVRDVANITQLLGSELDFMREVENVVTLDKVPDGFGYACLDNAGCLRTIGRSNSTSHVLAGSLRVGDTQVDIELVYLSVSTGRFVRRKTFTLDNSPEVIADNMGDIAREMVTGEGPGGGDAAADGEIDLMDFDEDFEVDFNKDDFAEAQAAEAAEKARREEEARRRREEEARRAAEEEARREAEEEARLKAEAEARRRAEAEERARREEEARREAEAEARRRAEEEEDRRRAAAAEERRRREAEAARLAEEEDDGPAEFDPNAISFGSAAIVVEDEGDSGIKEEPIVLSEEPEVTDYYEDDEPIVDLDDDEPVVADLDEPDRRDVREEREVREKPVKEKRDKPGKPKGTPGGFDDSPTAFTLALRGGYSPYYSLGFVTYGAEGQIAVGESGVHVLGGFQGWSVQREIPEEFQRLAGATQEWNTMFPINAGVIYKASVADGRVKPYGGADLVFARYYAGEEGSGLGSIAVGARARGGADIMIVRNFGLTADIAIGGWGGGDWVIIEEGVKNAGLLPQFSAGTVLAF